MAVRLRLMRTGKKKQPTYRIVATDSRSPRDGRFLEILGHYNPRVDPIELKVNRERVDWWLKNGAKPSDPVVKLFKLDGIIEK